MRLRGIPAAGYFALLPSPPRTRTLLQPQPTGHFKTLLNERGERKIGIAHITSTRTLHTIINNNY